MITVQCSYSDGTVIATPINATFEEAVKYFLGNTFNIGPGIEDNLQKCINVEEIK